MRWWALSPVIATALLLPSTAAAESISLGQTAPQGSSGGCTNCTSFQLQTAGASPSYVVPAGNWTIFSWTMMGGTNVATDVRLRIVRPEGALYRLVAESAEESLPAGGPRTFNTSIPVSGGDLLGLRTAGPSGDAVGGYLSGVNEDIVGGFPGGDPVLGQTAGPGGDFPLATFGQRRLNVATSLMRPDRPAKKKTTKKKKCKRKKRKRKAAAAKKKRCKKRKGKK